MAFLPKTSQEDLKKFLSKVFEEILSVDVEIDTIYQKAGTRDKVHADMNEWKKSERDGSFMLEVLYIKKEQGANENQETD